MVKKPETILGRFYQVYQHRQTNTIVEAVRVEKDGYLMTEDGEAYATIGDMVARDDKKRIYLFKGVVFNARFERLEGSFAQFTEEAPVKVVEKPKTKLTFAEIKAKIRMRKGIKPKK